MLNTEAEGSLINLDSFRDPFGYKLRITEQNEAKETNIDLCETFNYLIGLSVKHQSAMTKYNAVLDANGEYEGAVTLTKSGNGNNAFKHYEGVLRTGQKVLVIWRNLTGDITTDNAALDTYFVSLNKRDFDVIYVNGDNNLTALRTDSENWEVELAEIEFKKKIFDTH